MDCVTPSHPNKIPHGESLDIHQLLAKGEEAFLDPETVPKQGSIDLDKFPYTPRQTVMSALNASDDITYIRAQITDSDKELKEIIKESEKESAKSSTTNKSSGKAISSSGEKPSSTTTPSRRGRRPKPKVPIPPHAQPQRAMLMEVEDRWDVGYKRAFANNSNSQHGHGKPWLTNNQQWDNQWMSDGWEV